MSMKFSATEMVYSRRLGSRRSWIERCEFAPEYENLPILDDGCVEEFAEIRDQCRSRQALQQLYLHPSLTSATCLARTRTQSARALLCGRILVSEVL